MADMNSEKEKTNSDQKPVSKPGTPPPLVLGVDYYLENGRYVFTEHYHLKRGYCCQNGCRHCPYGRKKA